MASSSKQEFVPLFRAKVNRFPHHHNSGTPRSSIASLTCSPPPRHDNIEEKVVEESSLMVKSAAYIGGTETLSKFSVGTVELLSPTGSLNLRTSLVNRPYKNFTVSGPWNWTMDRDLSVEAKGPVASRLWVEKDWFDEK